MQYICITTWLVIAVSHLTVVYCTHVFAVQCGAVSVFVMSISLRIVCKTGAMGTSREGAVIATIGEAVILWETPFKYQVRFHCSITIACRWQVDIMYLLLLLLIVVV